MRKILARVCGIIFMVMFVFVGVASCRETPPIGTTILLFPEWEQSTSAFERKVFSNYYVTYKDDGWHVMEKHADGKLKPFFIEDEPHETIDDAKSSIRINIRWNVYRAMYDALDK